jgi:hypothetical protein
MANYNSIIPIMTSNSQNGFTLSATSGTSVDYYKGVDGISDGSSYYRSSVSPTLPEYYTVTFPRKYKVARYTLYLGYYNTQYSNMSTWEFQGLVDGVWITLHSGSNTQTRNTLTFDITPTDVDAIRIKCNSRHGTNSWGFDELIVYEVVYANKILILSNSKYKAIDYDDYINVVPILTSNNDSSGIVVNRSTAWSADFEAYKVFDGSTSSSNRWQSASGITSGWVSIDLKRGVKIFAYKVFNYDTTTPPRMAKNWTFEGSNDGANWIVLDTQINQTAWNANEGRLYVLSTPSEYRFFRINISANNGDSTAVTIGELNLLTKNYLIKEIPTAIEQDFINHGMDKSTVLDLSQKTSRKSFVEKNTITLGSGKVFSKPIDITQLPIKKLTIQ